MLAKRYSSLITACLLLLLGCSRTRPHAEYRVGIDPTWYPLTLEGKENSVTAFSTELLQEIGKEELIAFTKVSVSWNILVDGLKEKRYQAILTSLPPHPFQQDSFDFSDLYLATGPVLVVPENSVASSLDHLSGKEIAVVPESDGVSILEKYPKILIRSYTSIAQALNDVSRGVINGALVDVLIANSYCQDLYQGKLRIATPPLNNAGLRLVTLHNQATDLIDAFNDGLEAVKGNQTYDLLLKKWNLAKKE